RSMALEDFKGDNPKVQEDNRKMAANELEKLHEKLAEAVKHWRDVRCRDDESKNEKPIRLPPSAASEFYAILIVDGDEIGKSLRTQEGEDAAKEGLATFTRAVPAVVAAHDG